MAERPDRGRSGGQSSTRAPGHRRAHEDDEGHSAARLLQGSVILSTSETLTDDQAAAAGEAILIESALDAARSATSGTPVVPDDGAPGIAAAGQPTALRKRSLVIPFMPVLAAGIALAVHWWVPNKRASEISGMYARFLLGVVIAGLFLGFTQRLWRHSKLSLRRPLRMPFAAISNVMRWSVLNADVLGVGVLLICAWEMITL